VSPNEASLDLRETCPLSRNILHTCEVMAYGYTGQQMNQRMRFSNGCRHWLQSCTSAKVSAGHLIYPADVWDTAKSGMGRRGNRHLNYLVEFIFVNAGGSYWNANESSPQMSSMSVGGVIVVGARESRVQGEGRQGINASQLESNSESDEVRACRKVTL
jgi:hypothetical protein